MGASSSGVVIGPLQEGLFALTLNGLLPKLKGGDYIPQKQNWKIVDNSGGKKKNKKRRAVSCESKCTFNGLKR